MMRRSLLILLMLFSVEQLCLAGNSLATPQSPAPQVGPLNATESEDLQGLEQEIARLKREQQQRDEVLTQEIQRLITANQVLETVINNLLQRIEVLEGSGSQPQQHFGPVDAQTREPFSPEEQVRIQQEAEANYQLIQEAFEQRLVKEGGMLLPPYQFIYEPSLSYAHSSYDKIVVDGFTIYPVLVVGDIVSERVRRDIVTNQHTFRLGLPRDMQLDLVVPVGYEREHTFREDGTTISKNTTGFGDISLSLSHQLVKASRFWPDTVVGINWKPATGKDPYAVAGTDDLALGSGFETWGASLTSMTTADPVVLFAGLSATYTRGDEKDIGYVKPGEGFGLTLGMALALNFDTSLSFNYQYRYNREVEIDERSIDGSDLTTSTFSFGLSRTNNLFSAVDIDLGIGLTRDSPDFQLMVSFPFRFSLNGNK